MRRGVPQIHQKRRIIDGDKRAELADAALAQSWVQEGAVSVVFTAVYERTTGKYGDRGIRYVNADRARALQSGAFLTDF